MAGMRTVIMQTIARGGTGDKCWDIGQKRVVDSDRAQAWVAAKIAKYTSTGPGNQEPERQTDVPEATAFTPPETATLPVARPRHKGPGRRER